MAGAPVRDGGDAARAAVGKAARNPAYGLRTPDAAALTAALAGELAKVAAGATPPADALKRVNEAWDAPGPGASADQLRDWRRKALGLN